jgi:hypothetical protein
LIRFPKDACAEMPARMFKYGVPPQRIRTFLILFAVALAAPLLGLALYSLNRMAGLAPRAAGRRRPCP